MEQNESKPEIFTKRFLLMLLTISILTNIIVVTKYNFPNILNDIQLKFISPPEVVSTDHIRGNSKAEFTIIEYSDFQCYYSSQFHEAMRSITKNTEDVRWIYRHFPLGSHEYAKKAAEAAECAGEQGKFWEFADALFAFKGNISNEAIANAARKAGLNAKALGNCLNSGKHTDSVDAQRKSGADLKINGTPTFFINGKRISGYMPLNELRKLVK